MLRKKINWIMVTLVVSLVIFTGSNAFGVNLLTNGDFEVGDGWGDHPTGWTSWGPNCIVQHWDGPIGGYGYVYEGDGSMKFHSGDRPMQDYVESDPFALEPNSLYEVSFKVRAPWDSPYGGADAAVFVTVLGSDSLFEAAVNPRQHIDDEGHSGFYHFYEMFRTGPAASSGTLRFYHVGKYANAYLFFDNISVTPFSLFGGGSESTDPNQGATTPEPMTMSILVLGGLAVLRRRRR